MEWSLKLKSFFANDNFFSNSPMMLGLFIHFNTYIRVFIFILLGYYLFFLDYCFLKKLNLCVSHYYFWIFWLLLFSTFIPMLSSWVVHFTYLSKKITLQIYLSFAIIFNFIIFNFSLLNSLLQLWFVVVIVYLNTFTIP